METKKIFLQELAQKAGVTLPIVSSNLSIATLEENSKNAKEDACTFVNETSPSDIYNCKAGVILVRPSMANIIPRDEGTVIPVEDPRRTFEQLKAALG